MREVFYINSHYDSYIVEHRIKKTLKNTCFDEGKICLVARELISNILKYGGKGKLEIQIEGNLLRIQAKDEGKGQGETGLGIGLEIIEKNSDELKVEKNEKGGYTVNVKVRCKDNFYFEYAYSSKPHHFEKVSGDIFKAKNVNNDTKLFLVADVLGHGIKAHEETLSISEYVNSFSKGNIIEFYQGLERLLKNKRGCVIFICFISNKWIEYILVGNIRAWLITENGADMLKSQGGILGRIDFKVKINRLETPFKSFVILACTDGIKRDFSAEAVHDIMHENLQLLCDRIIEDYSIEMDDALVAALRRRV